MVSFAHINFFFSITLVVQVLFFISIYFFSSIPIPKYFSDRITELAKNHGVILNYDDIRLKFNGEIIANDVNLRFVATTKPFFSSSRMEVKISLASLLQHDVRFDSIKIYNGSISCGDDANKSSILAKRVFANLHRSGKWWKLNTANFKLGAMSIYISGILSEEFFDTGDKPNKEEKKGFRQVWNDACGKIFDAREYIDKFNDTVVTLDFLISSEKLEKLTSKFFAGNFNFDYEKTIFSAKNISLNLSYDSKSSKSKILSDFKAYDPNINSKKVADRFIATGLFDFEKIYGENVSISIINPQYEDYSLNVLRLKKSFVNMSDYLDKLSIFADSKDIKLDLLLKGNKQKLLIEFNSLLNPTNEMNKEYISNALGNKKFIFKNDVNLYGNILAESKIDNLFKVGNFDNLSLKADAYIYASECTFISVDAVELSSYMKYDSDSGDIWFENADVIAVEGWNIYGDIFQNLKTKDYQFLLSGTIRPMAIAHFMVEWWSEIFSDFNFENDFPVCDVAVSSKWENPEKIFSFGAVSGRDVIRNGISFDSVSLKFWINPSRISLYDVYATNENRKGNFAVEWRYYENRISSYDNMRILADCDFNNIELVALGGQRAKPILDFLESKTAPSIKLNLLLNNFKKYPNGNDLATLSYQNLGDIKVSIFDFKKLKFFANSIDDDIYIENVDLMFLDGNCKGIFSLKNAYDTPTFFADIIAENVNQRKLIEFFESMNPSQDSNRKNSQERKDQKIRDDGKVSFNLNIGGIITQLKSYSGGGDLTIVNNDLGTLNLLGMLSRATNSLGLPIASFDLKTASLNFTINDGMAYFKNIKMDGPSATILGEMKYNFLDDKMDSILVMMPFENVKNKFVSTIAYFVNPLATAVEAHITGNMSDPKVGIALRPMNVFENQTKMLENISNALNQK